MDLLLSLSWLVHGFSVKIAGIAGILILISLHEFGHFIFCKFFNVHTPSFSIGFGPKLVSKKIGDTEFSISAIPLGGYVEIAGMSEMGQGEQKEAHRTDERSFVTKPFYQKLCILSGGILFNLLVAYFIMIGLFFTGLPKTRLLHPFNANATIAKIETDSPAQQAGLQVGDTIISIDKQPLNNKALPLISRIKKGGISEVSLEVKRDNSIQTISCPVIIHTIMGMTGPWIGAEFETQAQEGATLWTAIKQGAAVSTSYIITMVLIFKHILTTFDVKNIGGPVSIISQTAQGAAQGWGIFLVLLVLISINLAILNLFPFPILDGGQILLYGFEALTGRTIPTKAREYINIASWLLILFLLILITFKDIRELIMPK